jgi:hypothetical protein
MNQPVTSFFTGDEAVALILNIMRPYSYRHLTNAEHIYNYTISME